MVTIPGRWGITGGGGSSRPVPQPVGTLGLSSALSVLIVALLAVFDIDVPLETVSAVLAGLNGILAAVIFRQPPASPPPE